MTTQSNRKRCFVIMGFGKKTDFETGRTLDLDKSYRNIVKPAVEAAGLECVRADEIVHSGLIDVPMYEQLLNADIVIADLSTWNKNALYELGIRHALRPYGTIIIAEDGNKGFPFDLNNVVVRQYHHLGEDIGYDEIIRFRDLLAEAIKNALVNEKKTEPIADSPVYVFLEKLQPPLIRGAIAQAKESMKQDTSELSKSSAVVVTENSETKNTLATLREQGEQAIRENRFIEAIPLFERALLLDQNDRTLIQQHVLATYKAGQPDPVTALFNARNLLAALSPEESTDRKTLELLGDIELALFDAKQGVNHLVSARHLYERLHKIKGDWRSGITLANLVVRHNEYKKNQIEKLADIVFADQLRRDVIQFGKERLAVLNELRRMEEILPKALKTEDRAQEQARVWCAIAEAYYGLGDNEGYLEARDKASRSKSGGEMLKTLDTQIGLFAHLLESQTELRRQAEGIFATRIFGETQTVSATTGSPDLPTARESKAAKAKVLKGARAGKAPTSLPRTVVATSLKGAGEEIFISYAWGDESQAIADKLDQAFQARGVTIVRDKRDLGFKGRIKEFMESIGQGRCVILVISEKYLKSENCLFELLQVAKHGDFSERIFPVVLDDARIYKPVDRIRYVQYWEKQLEELDAAMKSVSSVNMQGFREDIDLYAEIRAHLPRLADILKDMNALTPQIQRESGFAELFEAVMTKLAE